MKATRSLSLQRVFLMFSTVVLVCMVLHSICNIFILAIAGGILAGLCIVFLAIYRALKVPSVCNKEYNNYLKKGQEEVKRILEK
ncbi:hypothetical protein NEAUS03_1602 [Nematocida ausubeli]|nr:hypothetical protein NEAUS03_1602 [Nematocida ausubeli]